MKKRYRFLFGFVLLVISIYLMNASWLAPAPKNPEMKLLAHRGVHQTFDRTNLKNDTCTAGRIFAPTPMNI